MLYWEKFEVEETVPDVHRTTNIHTNRSIEKVRDISPEICCTNIVMWSAIIHFTCISRFWSWCLVTIIPYFVQEFITRSGQLFRHVKVFAEGWSIFPPEIWYEEKSWKRAYCSKTQSLSDKSVGDHAQGILAIELKVPLFDWHKAIRIKFRKTSAPKWSKSRQHCSTTITGIRVTRPNEQQ